MDEEMVERIEKTLNSQFLLKKWRVSGEVLEDIKKLVFVDERRRIRIPTARGVDISALNEDRVLELAKMVMGFLRYATSPEEGYIAMKAVLTFLEYWMSFRVLEEGGIRKLCDLANQVFPGKVVLNCEAMTYEEFELRRKAEKEKEAQVRIVAPENLRKNEENLMYL